MEGKWVWPLQYSVGESSQPRSGWVGEAIRQAQVDFIFENSEGQDEVSLEKTTLG